MIKKVLKFGGTSVGTTERIKHVANIIKKEYLEGNQIIVVVSAMAGKTNELLKLSQNIDTNFNKRELDVLLSSGEQVTCALLTGALTKLKFSLKNSFFCKNIIKSKIFLIYWQVMRFLKRKSNTNCKNIFVYF